MQRSQPNFQKSAEAILRGIDPCDESASVDLEESKLMTAKTLSRVVLKTHGLQGESKPSESNRSANAFVSLSKGLDTQQLPRTRSALKHASNSPNLVIERDLGMQSVTDRAMNSSNPETDDTPETVQASALADLDLAPATTLRGGNIDNSPSVAIPRAYHTAVSSVRQHTDPPSTRVYSLQKPFKHWRQEKISHGEILQRLAKLDLDPLGALDKKLSLSDQQQDWIDALQKDLDNQEGKQSEHQWNLRQLELKYRRLAGKALRHPWGLLAVIVYLAREAQQVRSRQPATSCAEPGNEMNTDAPSASASLTGNMDCSPSTGSYMEVLSLDSGGDNSWSLADTIAHMHQPISAIRQVQDSLTPSKTQLDLGKKSGSPQSSGSTQVVGSLLETPVSASLLSLESRVQSARQQMLQIIQSSLESSLESTSAIDCCVSSLNTRPLPQKVSNLSPLFISPVLPSPSRGRSSSPLSPKTSTAPIFDRFDDAALTTGPDLGTLGANAAEYSQDGVYSAYHITPSQPSTPEQIVEPAFAGPETDPPHTMAAPTALSDMQAHATHSILQSSPVMDGALDILQGPSTRPQKKRRLDFGDGNDFPAWAGDRVESVLDDDVIKKLAMLLTPTKIHQGAPESLFGRATSGV